MKRVLLALLITTSALASGGSESTGGNGDGSVRLPDGTPSLADRFVDRDKYAPLPLPGIPTDLADKLRDRLDVIRKLLDHYRIKSNSFWVDHIYGSRVEYRMVDALPCEDAIELKDSTLKSTFTAFACTVGWTTFLKADVFAALNPDQQALGLIHERLHAFYGSARDAHYWITPFIATLEDLLAIRELQLSGDRTRLSMEQIKKIEGLYEIAKVLGFSSKEPGNDFIISPQGGGLVGKNVEISDDSLIGIGSVIVGGVPDSTFVNTSLSSATVIGSSIWVSAISNSKIVDSSVEYTYYIAKSTIANCTLERVGAFHYSECSHSDITQASVSDNAKILGDKNRRSYVFNTTVAASTIKNSDVGLSTGCVGFSYVWDNERKWSDCFNFSERSGQPSFVRSVNQDQPCIDGAEISDSKLNEVCASHSKIQNTNALRAILWDAYSSGCKFDHIQMDEESFCIDSNFSHLHFQPKSALIRSRISLINALPLSLLGTFGEVKSNVQVQNLNVEYVNSIPSFRILLKLNIAFSGGFADFEMTQPCRIEVHGSSVQRSLRYDLPVVKREISDPVEFLNENHCVK